MASSVRDWQSRRRNEKTFAERKDRVTAAKWESRTIEGGRSEKTPRCDLAVSCVDGTCPAGSVLFKISFVNDWDSASVMSQELLLRLLSDRNFYFSEYRDLGNLRAGLYVYLLFFDSAGEILRLASMSPKDLLKEAWRKSNHARMRGQRMRASRRVDWQQRYAMRCCNLWIRSRKPLLL